MIGLWATIENLKKKCKEDNLAASLRACQVYVNEKNLKKKLKKNNKPPKKNDNRPFFFDFLP